MDYNLAKELRDSGFKQDRNGFMLIPHPKPFSTCSRTTKSFYDGVVPESEQNIYGKDLYEPSLSELIEACGDDFCFTLEINLFDKKWYAYDWDHQGHNYFYKGEGSTPSEAVARLWLAINKK